MEPSQNTAPATTIIQGQMIRACELRLERNTRNASGEERLEYLCGASGGPEQGYVLAREDEDLSPMLAACNHCPIPDALESRRACLNLVPVRRFAVGKHPLPLFQPGAPSSPQDEAADAFFACRWFYIWYGPQQPRTMAMCLDCPHWFPRPPCERIPNYWPMTRKMLRIVSGEESTVRPPTGFAPAPRITARPWWQRLFHRAQN